LLLWEEEEGGGRREEGGGRREEEGGRRKEEGGRRKEEGGGRCWRSVSISISVLGGVVVSTAGVKCVLVEIAGAM
jgi:hypothetical protein